MDQAESPNRRTKSPLITPLEVLIVAVIVGTLGAIALPQLADRTSARSRYVAVISRELIELGNLQTTYFAEHGRFASSIPPGPDTAHARFVSAITITTASEREWAAIATHPMSVRWCGIRGDLLRVADPVCSADPLVGIVLPLNAVDSAVLRLPWAGSALNTPETMVLRRTGVVAFVLDPTQAPLVSQTRVRLPRAQVESLIATVVRIAGPDVPVEARPIRYAPRMVARLEGQGFDISPADDQLQGISSAERTEWIWEVTPRRTGKQILQLTVDALLDINGRETPKRFRVLRKEIVVRVHWPRAVTTFVVDNWQWFAGAAVPIGGFLWAWLRKRRRRPIGFSTGDTEH